jgi:predicted RNase H-like HicB family nuclease
VTKRDRLTYNPARIGDEPCIQDLRLTVRRVLEALVLYPDRQKPECGVNGDFMTDCGLISVMHVGDHPALRVPNVSLLYCQRKASVIPMTLHDYKTVLYRQDDGSWVAEIPALTGRYALVPTRVPVLAELGNVFEMVAEEYRERGVPLPTDTTEIVPA